jgi:SAM-dependent methyltransferase
MSEILYVHNHEVHNTKAAETFIPFLLPLIQPKSVIDFGCGTGTWLAAFQKAGITDVLGVDGDYVDRSMLHIDSRLFYSADLRKEILLSRRYDLALCLEVAEHLPLDSAETIIKTLVNHSNNILFSAALPLQGGQNHLNEQSFIFWEGLFTKHGYRFVDAFRNIIWNNEAIDWWYRQNIFLVTNNDDFISMIPEDYKINDYYHPKLYLELWRQKKYYKEQFERSQTVAGALKTTFNVLVKKIFGR